MPSYFILIYTPLAILLKDQLLELIFYKYSIEVKVFQDSDTLYSCGRNNGLILDTQLASVA